MSDSATGGYLIPTITPPLPGNLSIEDFIQTVIVGISGYPGNLVRPRFQVAPPKNPSIETDWIAFGIENLTPDANAYVGKLPNDTDILARTQRLEIQVAFYGPNSLDNIAAFIDGFQITQNLEAMLIANIAFNGISQAIRGPDLLNERWVNRYETTLTLVRTIQRFYPILSFASAAGSIHTVVDNEDLTIQWETEQE